MVTHRKFAWSCAVVLIGSVRAAFGSDATAVRPCDAHTNVGALFLQQDSGETSLMCSGVLLENDVVMTAAHCLVADERGGLHDPSHLLFVLGEHPYPINRAPRFFGHGAVVSPDFSLRRLLTSPLYARRAEGDQEKSALSAIEQRCGRRDDNRFGELEWLGCLLEQSPELRRAVGLHDREAGEHDVGLLFLAPNERQQQAGGRLLPTACGVRRPATAGDVDAGAAQPHAQERLMLAGYNGGTPDPNKPWPRALLETFFAPIARHEQKVRAVEVGHFEIQLSDDAAICETDGGGALFRLPKPKRSAELVGIVSRRPRAREFCGRGGVATNLQPYWPWVDRALAEGCARGLRHALACPKEQPGTAARRKRTDVSGPVKKAE